MKQNRGTTLIDVTVPGDHDPDLLEVGTSSTLRKTGMAETRGQDPQSTDRARLNKHFQNFSDADNTYIKGWDDLWQTKFLPFDRDKPSPAIIDTLQERRELIKDPFIIENGVRRRKRALVPGCGRGYDVLLLASCGYDTYGVEASENAIMACKEFATHSADQYPTWDREVGQGEIHWVCADFFGDDWRTMSDEKKTNFDLIYDYTVCKKNTKPSNIDPSKLIIAQFLCALTPSLRPKWALRMSQLLAPSPAVLICLEFPTYKDPSTGGPPYALPPAVYFQHLSRPGETIPYREDGHIVEQTSSVSNEDALIRIAHWRAERTHPIGQGTDHVSLWQHK